MSNRISKALFLSVIWLTVSLNVHPAIAQLANYAQQGAPPDPGLALLQEEPHDLLFFTVKAGGGWAKTLLLQLPGQV